MTPGNAAHGRRIAPPVPRRPLGKQGHRPNARFTGNPFDPVVRRAVPLECPDVRTPPQDLLANPPGPQSPGLILRCERWELTPTHKTGRVACGETMTRPTAGRRKPDVTQTHGATPGTTTDHRSKERRRSAHDPAVGPQGRQDKVAKNKTLRLKVSAASWVCTRVYTTTRRSRTCAAQGCPCA